MLWETKIDETFPNQPFNISNYKTLFRDRKKHGWRLLLYINENIPCKVINVGDIPNDTEMILFEFLVKTRKWFCVGTHILSSQNKNYFHDTLSKVLSKLTCQYDNNMLIGEFDLTANKKNLGVFYEHIQFRKFNK